MDQYSGGAYTWSAASWAALAAWVTAGVAVLAGVVAVNQLAEARRLRLERSQPYVVVFMDLTVSPKFVDLVIRNFGATAATDIKVSIDPPPQRAAGNQDGPEDLWLPDVIPTLVPGQEWRTLWDFIPKRAEAGLPDRARAVVSFRDSQEKPVDELSYDLDWEPFNMRGNLIEYGPHDTAKALRDMKKEIGKWRESIHGGLAVTVRDGDAKDEARRAEVEDAP